MGILIRNNIVNQKGNPAWYEDTLANRPTANLQGRMFVDTNNPSTGIYRDTGSSWVAVADPGAGTTGTLQQVTTNGSTTNVGISITTLTPGSVLFSGTGGLISQDNTNLFWDDANNFLGIGPTGGPTALLDIHSATQNIFIQVNATSTNNSQVAFLNGGVGKWRIGNLYNAGANDFIIFDTTNSLSRLTIKNTGNILVGTGTDLGFKFTVSGTAYISGNVLLRTTNTGADGLGIAPEYNVSFTEGSGQSYVNLYRQYNSAGGVLAQGYKRSATGSFASSYSGLTARAAILVGDASGSISFYSDAATTVANGTDISVTPKMTLINSGKLTISATDSTGNRTNAFDILTLTTNNPNNPYEKFGGAILFNNSSYTHGVVSSARLRSFISDGGGNEGGGFIFETTPTAGGTLTTSLTLKYTGVVNIATISTYASNALAIAGGLVIGDLYKNSVGVLSIVY
jgi:hypothetical protein